jgi:ABC-type phosphate transport system substrate-binding protein
MRQISSCALGLVMLAMGVPAKPVASASFEVIVNAANPAPALSANELRDVLLGTRREWPNHRRITVVQRDAGSPVVAAVFRSVLGMSVSEYNRYLLDFEFRGKGTIPLKAMTSDDAICEFVFNAPGALGFVPSQAMAAPSCSSKVRVLPIKGKHSFE